MHRLADQTTLNQKLIMAKLNEEISQEDFDTMKESIKADAERIQKQITALDSERSTMEELMQQAQIQIIDLVHAWKTGSVNQRQEMVKGLFPDGIAFSHKLGFFEPCNVPITAMFLTWLETPPE